MTSIRSVLDQYVTGDVAALEAALVAREDGVADLLRLAGVQFGLYPEIVAKVLMDVGLGTPVPEATQVHINQNFATRMEWLRQQIIEQRRREQGEN